MDIYYELKEIARNESVKIDASSPFPSGFYLYADDETLYDAYAGSYEELSHYVL